MARKLPARTDSRNVQRQHTRKIMTIEGPRNILINKGNRKDLKIRKRKSVSIATRKRSISKSNKTRPILKIRERWQDIIRPDTTKLSSPLEKEMKRKGIILYPREKVIKVKSIGVNRPWESSSIMAAYAENNQELIITLDDPYYAEMALRAKESDSRLIYKPDEYGSPLNAEYVREFAPIVEDFQTDSTITISQTKSPDGKDLFIFVKRMPGKEDRVIGLPSEKEFFKRQAEAQHTPYDVFGDRWFEQSKLQEFLKRGKKQTSRKKQK